MLSDKTAQEMKYNEYQHPQTGLFNLKSKEETMWTENEISEGLAVFLASRMEDADTKTALVAAATLMVEMQDKRLVDKYLAKSAK